MAVCAVVSAWSLPAEALLIQDPNTDDFSVSFDGVIDGTVVSGLESNAAFDFTGSTFFGGQNVTEFYFDITLSTDLSAPITSARVSGIGFATAPDIIVPNNGNQAPAPADSSLNTGVSRVTTDANASPPFEFIIGGNFPQPGVVNIEFCITGGGNSCQGGGNVGVSGTSAANGSETFSIALAVVGDQTANGLTLDQFAVRYQSIVGTNLGTSGVGQGRESHEIPEPASLTLLGVGLAGLAWVRRRRRAGVPQRHARRAARLSATRPAVRPSHSGRFDPRGHRPARTSPT